jgi:hypothetical protein
MTTMNAVTISVGAFSFRARWETSRSPASCAALAARLPLAGKLIQARWSGEACWVPLGDLAFGVGPEQPIGSPAPGQILLYPGGISETEILIPYGPTRFACSAGAIAGNHVLTILDADHRLAELGAFVLWKGAQDIRFG